MIDSSFSKKMWSANSDWYSARLAFCLLPHVEIQLDITSCILAIPAVRDGCTTSKYFRNLLYELSFDNVVPGFSPSID